MMLLLSFWLGHKQKQNKIKMYMYSVKFFYYRLFVVTVFDVYQYYCNNDNNRSMCKCKVMTVCCLLRIYISTYLFAIINIYKCLFDLLTLI